MSTSQGTTSSVDELAPLSDSSSTESSLDRKVGMAQKFDKEMKDYAKATVKEFLGIYGYEEDVDINIEDSGDSVNNRSENTANGDAQTESGSSSLNQQTSQPHFEAVSTSECTSNELISDCEEEISPLARPSVIVQQSAGPISYAVVPACFSTPEFNRTGDSLGDYSPTVLECKTEYEPGAVMQEDTIEERASYFNKNLTAVEMSSVFTGSLSQKDKSRLRMRRRRLNETPEMRASRLKVQRERARTRRANETQAEREFRLVKDRVRQKLKRTYESEVEREKRLLQQRESARRRRALESPEQKKARQLRDKERTRRSRETKRAGVAMEWW